MDGVKVGAHSKRVMSLWNVRLCTTDLVVRASKRGWAALCIVRNEVCVRIMVWQCLEPSALT